MPVEDRVLWSRLSTLVADSLGLNFPPERWADLRRGVAAAAPEFGFEDGDACAEWMLSTSPAQEQFAVLARHLTIGETYFFREKKTFETLRNRVLAELLRARRGRRQCLRFWSAGCCTGEEPYSLAILLRELLPEGEDWQITILATDINANFLRKAVDGIYGNWSFRDAPRGFKETYFTSTADGRYEVLPEIKKLVTFAPLNLAEEKLPSLVPGFGSIDVVFCRNVLMYFTPAQTRRVIANLHRSLADGGWLIVSPSEVSQVLFPQFATRNFPDVIFYQRDDSHQNPTSPVSQVEWVPQFTGPLPDFSANSIPTFFGQESGTGASRALSRGTPSPDSKELERDSSAAPLPEEAQHSESESLSVLTRSLADEGRLDEALITCDRWVEAEKLNASAHYLRAMILIELSQPDPARKSLIRALYLQSDLPLAHFALGNLARGQANQKEASKHYANALRLMERLRPDDTLADSDGLTAGQLIESINAMNAGEKVR